MSLICRTGRSYRCLTRRGAVKLAASVKATSLQRVLVMVTWADPEIQRDSALPEGPMTYGSLHVEIEERGWRPWLTVRETWIGETQ